MNINKLERHRKQLHRKNKLKKATEKRFCYRVLKFNPKSQSISLIGESFGDGEGKWSGSILASDGFIYCVPCSADDILKIDSRHTNDQILTMMESL